MHTLSASAYLEIRATLSGTFCKGYAETGPSYSCAGEPGEPDSVEDIAVDGLHGYRTVRVATGDGWSTQEVYVDLLKGVDPKAPGVAQLLQNIADFLGQEAEDALLEEAAEW